MNNTSFTNSPLQSYKQKPMTDFLSSDTKLRSPIPATPPSSRRKLARSRSRKQKGTDVKDKVKTGKKDLNICQKGTDVKDKVRKFKNDLCEQTIDTSVIVVQDNSLNASVDRLDKDKKKIGNNTLIDTSFVKNIEDKKENKNKRSKRSKDKLFNRAVESPKSTLFTTKLNITNSKHDKVRKTKKWFSSDSDDDEKLSNLVLDRRKSNDVLKSFPFKSHLVNLPYLSPSKLEVEGKHNKSDIEIALFGKDKLTSYKIPNKRKNNDNSLLENKTRSTKECDLLVEFKRGIREDNKLSSTKLLNKENINNSVTIMTSDKVKSSKVITSTPTKVEMKTRKQKPIFNADKLSVVTSNSPKKSNTDKLSVVTSNSPKKSKINKDKSVKSSINQNNLKTPEKKENGRDCDKKKSPKKSRKNNKETESYKPLTVVSKSKETNVNSPRKIDDMTEIKPEKKRKKTVLKYGMRLPSFADIKKTKQKFIEYNNNIENVKTLQEIDLPDCKEYEINKNKSLTVKSFLDCKHLPVEKLEELFDDNKNYLILITKGEVFSERHRQFIKNPSGSNEFNTRELTYNTSMMVFTKGQKLLLANLIDGIFKDKFFTYNSQYYFKVLLPELCLIIFMNIHHMDRENATKYLQNIPTDLS